MRSGTNPMNIRTGNPELLLWNASVSKTVLKGKGTLRLSANDILGQQVNMTRRFQKKKT